MLLSIISLNYKNPQSTSLLMASLWKYFEKEFKNKEFECIIVDNHSEDDSVEILKNETKKYSNFFLYVSKENSGFGAGNNFGVKKARGEYLLFLNNDTVVTNTSLIDMVTVMKENPETAILGGELMNADGTTQPSGGRFYTLFNVTALLLGLQRVGAIDKNPKKIQEIEWVKGGCLMIRKRVFEKLKGFDEKIFMYGEDMELCFRARKLGFLTYFYPHTGILHKEQGSSDRSFAIINIYRSLLYFYKKHRPAWEYRILWMILIIKACILIGIGKIIGNSYLSRTYEKALAVC